MQLVIRILTYSKRLSSQRIPACRNPQTNSNSTGLHTCCISRSKIE